MMISLFCFSIDIFRITRMAHEEIETAKPYLWIRFYCFQAYCTLFILIMPLFS